MIAVVIAWLCPQLVGSAYVARTLWRMGVR